MENKKLVDNLYYKVLKYKTMSEGKEVTKENLDKAHEEYGEPDGP